MKDRQPLEIFSAKIKSKNLKATPQRMAVHEAMLELGHASADMVMDRIREKGKVKVTVASVYNILSGLADAGIYRRLPSMEKKMYFDVNTGNHIHLYNAYTGEYTDILDQEAMEFVASHFRKKHFKGLKVESINVQLICRPNARKKKI